jgi:hypothetical protein
VEAIVVVTKRTPVNRPPKGRITPEILAAFRRALTGDKEARTRFHVLTARRPWEISPLDVLDVDEPDGEPEDYVQNPWRGSWWQAKAFRDALELAAADAH